MVGVRGRAAKQNRGVARACLALLALVALIALVSFAGCGGGDSGGSPADASSPEAATAEAAADATPPPYQQFPIDLPVVHDFGGPRLTHPNIVAFVDPADERRPAFTALLQSIGASDYWQSVTKEYGIGPLGTVTVSNFPSTLPESLSAADLATLRRRARA